MPIQCNAAVLTHRLIVEQIQSLLDAQVMAVGQQDGSAAEANRFLVRHIRSIEITVAPHILQHSFRIMRVKEGLQCPEIPGTVPQMKVGVHRAGALPGFPAEIPDAVHGPMAVAHHQCLHARASRISSILAQALARWLTAFFSSSVTSAKVLFSGS